MLEESWHLEVDVAPDLPKIGFSWVGGVDVMSTQMKFVKNSISMLIEVKVLGTDSFLWTDLISSALVLPLLLFSMFSLQGNVSSFWLLLSKTSVSMRYLVSFNDSDALTNGTGNLH